jgi:mannose/fructose/N-acetylgalactosamine-specific phosphotransferase system component IIC
VSVAAIMIEAASLFALTCGLLLYGLRLKKKLSISAIVVRSNFLTESEMQAQMAALHKINSVLLICSVCYFVRVFLLTMLAIYIYDSSRDVNSFLDIIPLIVWFLLSSWVPVVLPVSHPLHSSLSYSDQRLDLEIRFDNTP